ncbi:glucose-methanol-choline oxidoreductase [Calothrix brevissima NIES-22]|nr:glucose-methanol-choline oxidoreductase [Calothrix brevissima NIES-22]
MSQDNNFWETKWDICIVGTGAAGGILAHQLAMHNFSVISLEHGEKIDNNFFSNHLNPEQEKNFGIAPDMPWPVKQSESFHYDNWQANQLYAKSDILSTSSRSAEVFHNHQIFRLNGKQNLWNGVCLRYSERDFRGRDYGDSDSNWPIGYTDLENHYTEVERLIGVCGTKEGLDCLPDGEFIPAKPLRPADQLLIEGVKKISGINIKAIPNRKAIETRSEAANQCQSCGACHYGCSFGSMYKFSSHLLPRIVNRSNYQIIYNCKVIRLHRKQDSTQIHAVECIDTKTYQKFQVEAKIFILAAGALETPRILFNSEDDLFPEGYANSSNTLGCYLQDNIKANIGTSLLKLIGKREKYDVGFGDNLIIPRFLFENQDFRGGYMAQYHNSYPKRPYYLDGFETCPDWLKKWIAKLLFRSYAVILFQGKPDVKKSNRVFPSQEQDIYGIRKIDVEYEMTENDRQMQQSMLLYGKQILSKCSGTLMFTYTSEPGHSIHYAGTCRMANNSHEGVVNQNLRSFDHENLYVCDGSVIPEISEKNYTLTIMALAHRLATYVAKELSYFAVNVYK